MINIEENMKISTSDLIHSLKNGNKHAAYELATQCQIADPPMDVSEIENQPSPLVDLSHLTIEQLVTVHEKTTWSAPAYFLRLRLQGKWKELSDDMLITLIQTLSPAAKETLFSRYDQENVTEDKLRETTDETLALFAQSGCELSQDILFEKYIPYISKIIDRLLRKGNYFKGHDRFDLNQEAFIGMFKARRDYRVEKKTKFKIFARHVVEKHVKSLILQSTNNKQRSLNEASSYHAPMVSDSSSDITFEQILKTDSYGPEERSINRETFRAIWERLTPLEKKVLLLYAEDYSYQEIGERVDKEKKAVDNTIQRIRNKGKAYIKEILMKN